MSRIGPEHSPGCGLEGKCSVPVWQGESPSGFCDRPAYGYQYDKRGPYAPHYWGPWDRRGYLVPNGWAPPYAPAFCCDHHGGPAVDAIRFVRDGDMWCAFMPDFVNLQESVAGFGKTQSAAERDLRERLAIEKGRAA